MDKRAEAQLDAARRNLSELAHPRLLPRYSRASFSSVQSVELLEHTYTLQDSKGRPFITLHVKSRAKDKKTWPLFCERDVIHGAVEVDFDKTDGAKAVSIAVSLSSQVAMVGSVLCFLILKIRFFDLVEWRCDGGGARRAEFFGFGKGAMERKGIRKSARWKDVLAILDTNSDGSRGRRQTESKARIVQATSDFQRWGFSSLSGADI